MLINIGASAGSYSFGISGPIGVACVVERSTNLLEWTGFSNVANFSGSPKPDYRVGLPFAGRWREVLNTDADDYGGSGVGNFGGVNAEEQPWHGRPASAVVTLPPLATLWLRYEPEPVDEAVVAEAVVVEAVVGDAVIAEAVLSEVPAGV